MTTWRRILVGAGLGLVFLALGLVEVAVDRKEMDRLAPPAASIVEEAERR